MKNINKALDSLTSPIFAKNGFVDHRIIKFWPLIIGDTLAKHTSPLKVVFTGDRSRSGVLHVGISNSALALQIQAQEGRIIEKISTYFGYQAVSRIKLTIEKSAGKKMETKKAYTKTTISSEDNSLFSMHLDNVRDKGLQNILSSLSSNLFDLKP